MLKPNGATQYQFLNFNKKSSPEAHGFAGIARPFFAVWSRISGGAFVLSIVAILLALPSGADFEPSVSGVSKAEIVARWEVQK